jgi:uncharacterized Zn-finger protein
MSGSSYPMFLNVRGVPEIRIGVREFECIGVFPPLDHPHIYINMRDEDTILPLLRDAVPLRSSIDAVRCGSSGQPLCCRFQSWVRTAPKTL